MTNEIRIKPVENGYQVKIEERVNKNGLWEIKDYVFGTSHELMKFIGEVLYLEKTEGSNAFFG